MKTSFRSVSLLLTTGAALTVFAFLSPNCQPSGGDTTPSTTGTGGRTASSGTGGATSASGTGGTTSASGTGGATSASGTGGRTSASGTGGTTSASGTGGATTASGTGGATTASGTGGTTTASGTGGSTSAGSTPTGKIVTFASGKGVGAMTGYGWVALGSLDTVTDPTCGPTKTPITSTAACAADPNWSSTSSLCVSGSVPALPATPAATDYANNWGLSVGVNSSDSTTAPGLGQSPTSVTIAVSGTPSSGLRVVAHRASDPASTSYCLPYAAGALTLTSFVTDCYNTTPTGTKLTAADIPNIDKISIQVSSTSAAITVTSLCITGITFQ